MGNIDFFGGGYRSLPGRHLLHTEVIQCYTVKCLAAVLCQRREDTNACLNYDLE